MTIDFDRIPESIIPNFKGGEKALRARIFDDGTNKILKGLLVPGASIGLHTHETNCETILILKGHGSIIYDGETAVIHEGDVHYCPKGHTHSLVNDSDSDLEFIGVVPERC